MQKKHIVGKFIHVVQHVLYCVVFINIQGLNIFLNKRYYIYLYKDKYIYLSKTHYI